MTKCKFFRWNVPLKWMLRVCCEVHKTTRCPAGQFRFEKSAHQCSCKGSSMSLLNGTLTLQKLTIKMLSFDKVFNKTTFYAASHSGPASAFVSQTEANILVSVKDRTEDLIMLAWCNALLLSWPGMEALIAKLWLQTRSTCLFIYSVRLWQLHNMPDESRSEWEKPV